jgi:hypothetical protein
MRLLTGGHAIWMGGWTGQVHLHQDFIGPGGLTRSSKIQEVLLAVSAEVEPGTYLVPPAYALADSLIHKDHRIMPADEIDPDYLDRDERPFLRSALEALGAHYDEIDDLVKPYEASLDPDTEPQFR